MALLLVCLVAEVVIARRWAQTRTRLGGRVALIGLMAAVTLPIISVLVVTDREQIEQTCQLAGNAIDDGNLRALRDLLASTFHAEGIDREDFLRRAEETMTRNRVDRIRLRNFDVSFPDPSDAVATFDATCAVRSADAYADSVPTRWRLEFHLVDDRWRITEVRSIPIPPFFFRGFSDAPH
ncbi:MAG: hypothetical protein HYR83_02470 [Planctomycetes bacterium]|nr:hypothetical protein [Planctomycetota bacterium]